MRTFKETSKIVEEVANIALQAAEEKGLTFREVLYLPEMIDARIKKEIEKMETLAKLKEILSECKGEELDVNMDTTFDELDFDSLDKVDIVMQIEEAYDISLGDNMALSTVGELVKKIDEAVANE